MEAQTRLINDLLDVSRITAGTLKLSLAPCDLNAIVREAVADVQITAPERTFLLDLREETPITVLVDRGRIHQVVTNYLTNALRYASPERPISIGIQQEQGMVRVWVRDQGPGLSKQAQKDIWQRFHQVPEVPIRSGSGKGLGLGLSICKMLIEQHHGEVGVESTPGAGSAFWFRLPEIALL